MLHKANIMTTKSKVNLFIFISIAIGYLATKVNNNSDIAKEMTMKNREDYAALPIHISNKQLLVVLFTS